MKNLFCFSCLVLLLAACQVNGNYPVRAHDYADYNNKERLGAPRHTDRDNFSAVEAAEGEYDDVCVGPTCSCDAE